MRALLRCSVALAASLTFTAVAPAFAQDIAQAEQFFEEGNAAEQQGDCALAIEKFELALTIKETPQLHLRVGRCHAKLNHLADAYASYERAADISSESKLTDMANEMKREVEERVPMIMVTIEGGGGAATLKINGKDASAGENVRANPGDVTIEARAPGYNAKRQKITLEEGEKKQITITLTKESEPEAPAPQPEEDSGGPGPAPFILYGVAGVGVAFGIGFLVGSMNIEAEGDERCPNRTADGEYICPADFVTEWNEELRPESNRNQAISIVSFIAAAGAATTATILLVMSGSSGEEEKPADGSAVSHLAVTPVVVPGGAFVSASGRF